MSISQTIIGIKVENDTFKAPSSAFNAVIYTTRYVVYITIRISNDLQDCSVIEQCCLNLTYWIIDCICISPWAFILNSRNEVLILNLTRNEVCFRLFGTEKCILYCGKLLQVTPTEVVVASGTVFKKILLWGFEYTLEESSVAKFNVQDLTGHDGVIFAIDYNRDNNILISASDDRSVRLWKGSLENSPKSVGLWKSNYFQLIHVYYGHTARIWKVLSTGYNHNPIVCSVGEDSNLILWSQVEPYREIQRICLGRNNRIWCLEIFRSIIACGGSDGSLKFVNLDHLESQSRVCHRIQSPKALRFIKSNPFSLLSMATNSNFNLATDSLDSLHFGSDFCHIFHDYISCDINENRDQVLLASKFGHVALIDFTKPENAHLVFMKKVLDSKILNINFLSPESFITCLTDGSMRIFQLEGQSSIVSVGEDYILPQSRHRWSSCSLRIENLLIIGDYSGNVFGFLIPEPSPSICFRNVHGSNCVTCVKRNPSTPFVYTSGRNGKIIEYLIKSVDLEITEFVKLRTYALFSDIEWIGGFEFNCTAIRYVYGFEARTFRVWDTECNSVVFEEECGGGHRSWDVKLTYSQLRFAYSKQNNVIVLSRQLQSKPSLKSSFPSLSRKINCCCSVVFNLQSMIYILISGEENTIQIIRYDRNSSLFEPYISLHGHISNVTALRCVPVDGKPVTYAISVGGRSQLILWRLSPLSSSELVVEELACNFLGLYNEHLEFESKIRKANQSNPLSGIDIRYLDVDFVIGEEFLILVACSDCFIRIFEYDGQKIITKQIVQVGKSCVLLARFLHLRLAKLESNLLAIASNDGQLHLMSSPGNVTLLCHQQLHQSGINSLDYRLLNGESLPLPHNC